MSSAVPTDEIYERYLQKAISEINELGDEISRAGDETHIPVLGSGHPLADVFLLMESSPSGAFARDRVALGSCLRGLLEGVQQVYHPED